MWRSSARRFGFLLRPSLSSEIVIFKPATTSCSGVRSFATSFPPHTTIMLPALSPTMTEGGLAKWKKKDGESIKPGEVLCEIETDKATVDFEFQEDGILAKRLVNEGTTGLKVGTVIGIMVEDAANVSAFASAAFADFNAAPAAAAASTAASSPPAKAQVVSLDVEKLSPTNTQAPAAPKAAAAPKAPAQPASPSQRSERVFASPLARRLAREQNKRLDAIQGSGPNGRILAADVKEAKDQPQGSSADAAASFTDSSWTLNKLSTPHYYLNVDVDLTAVIDACEFLNKGRKDKVPISVNDFIVRTAALAMRKVPEANAAWGDGGSIRIYEFCDMNISIASAAGIVRSPILRNVHAIGLAEIATKLKEIEAQVEKGEQLDESAGTFSLINVGAFGVRSMVPIIRPGQTTALGVGALRRTLVPSEGATPGAKVASVATVTLSCDHRVVDGAIGAEWLHEFKSLIETPMSMLL